MVVIGGGINGAAIARDAALRGLSVLLVEKADFASGTSSKSTKLIHGGLRYLEHYQFGLVRESLRERALLATTVPHLVAPLRFVFPVLEGARPPWLVAVGLTFYDWLAGRNAAFPRHRRLPPEAVAERLPALEGPVRCGFEYYDAQMDDARLVVENIAAAERHGAVAVNYCQLDAVELHNGKVAGVRLCRQGRKYSVATDVVVQATGVWTRPLDGDPTTPQVGPSKGSHIVLPDMGLRCAVTLPVPKSERIFFLIPWHGRTLVGTTDENYAGSLEDVQATAADALELLACVAHYFPSLPAKPTDIVGAFAGLRPLIAHGGSSARASREHEIHCSSSGVISIVGGKYTTYRAIAEQVCDRLPNRPGPGRTRSVGLTQDLAPEGNDDAFGELGASERATLLARYGSRAADVARCIRNAPGGAEWLGPGPSALPGIPHYLQGEIDFAVRVDHAREPPDWFERRSLLRWTRPDGGRSLAAVVAGRMGQLLGWSDQEQAKRLAAYQAEVDGEPWRELL